jgi:hypothetical protein
MNRVFQANNSISPYDRNFYLNNENGKDCDGNKGKNLYCYCPS